MTDLATPVSATPVPVTPLRGGSAGSAWLKWLARRLGLAVLTRWPRSPRSGASTSR